MRHGAAWRAMPGIPGRWRLMLILTLLFAGGCSTSPPPEPRLEDPAPAWVVAPPQSDRVLYGVGGASAGIPRPQRLTAARDAALADLVAGLRVEVRAETRASVSETDGVVDTAFTQQTATRIEPMALEAVTNEAAWESPRGDLYVLVALDREQAAARVRRAYVDAMTGQAVLASDATGWAAWREWQDWARHLAEQAARDRLHRLFTGRSVAPDWPDYQREQRKGYATFVANQPIQVRVMGALDDARMAPVLAVWSDQGFPLLARGEAPPPGSAPPWEVRLAVRFDDQSDARVTRLFATVEAQVVDAAGQQRWQAAVGSRGIAVSRDLAENRALKNAADALRASWQAGRQDTERD